MNIVEIMITTIKAKLMPIINKLKLLTNKSFIKNKLLVRIRNFFFRLFDIRPRDERDYYPFLGFLVSRRLAMAVVVIVTVLCVSFLWSSKPDRTESDNPYKAYKYNSLMLKFTTGKAQILGKSGYMAYVGDVENGIVKGRGTLYGPQGNIVYDGEFDANAYNGAGKYYENSRLRYEGTFKDNLYEGEGRLYSDNEALRYEGSFHLGRMSGDGTLFNASQTPVYKGRFQDGWIVYQELIGKKTAEVSQMYTGARTVLTADDVYEVYMKEIDAIYFGDDAGNTLDEEFTVRGVYVLKPQVYLNGKVMESIGQVRERLGEPVYEGNTYLKAEDEIALNKACELSGEKVLYGKSGCREMAVYDDVTEVSGFDGDYQAYIYMYENEGIAYTFFCKDKDAGFDFYRMEE